MWGFLLNRNQGKARAQKAVLQAKFPAQRFDSVQVNLMDIDHIRRASHDIALRHREINALYNVAGVLTDKLVMSVLGSFVIKPRMAAIIAR